MSDTNAPAHDAPKLDVKSSHVHKTWKHAAPLIGCRYDPTGRFIFTSSMDNTLQRWNLETDEHTTFKAHECWSRAIGFSPNGEQLFTAGYEGKLCFWQTAEKTLKATKEIDAHEGWVRVLSVHPNGKLLATAGNDMIVKLWSTESGELIRELKSHEKHIYSLFLHPNGTTLLSGDLKGVVHQWEIESGKLERSIEAKELYTYHGGQQVDYGGVRAIALSPDGKHLGCGGLHKATNPFAGVQEPLLVIFDWESGEQIRTHEANGIPRGIIWRLFYQPDGTTVAGVGGDNSHLVFWNNEKTEFHKVSMGNSLLDMDRHPNGIDLITAHHQGDVRITRMAAKT